MLAEVSDRLVLERGAQVNCQLSSPTYPALRELGVGRRQRITGLADTTRLGSFATGAYDSHVVVEANGSQGGIQIVRRSHQPR